MSDGFACLIWQSAVRANDFSERNGFRFYFKTRADAICTAGTCH
jgi:hypothetical protein